MGHLGLGSTSQNSTSTSIFSCLSYYHIKPTHPHTMVLRLRLSRVSTPTGAKRHKPFYNIVLAHARTARDSKPLEVLGTYDPIPQTPIGAKKGDRKVKDIKIDVTRARYWLGVGAQPSDTVWRLLSMVCLTSTFFQCRSFAVPPRWRRKRGDWDSSVILG